MKEVTIYLDDELRIAIKGIARRTKRSEASVIREALVAYVAQQPRELPGVFGSVSDGTISAAHYDEWPAENWKPDW